MPEVGLSLSQRQPKLPITKSSEAKEPGLAQSKTWPRKLSAKAFGVGGKSAAPSLAGLGLRQSSGAFHTTMLVGAFQSYARSNASLPNLGFFRMLRRLKHGKESANHRY